MCGIVGYVGFREAEPILVEGLRRLEYRGYDSAGVAILNGGLHVRKRAGRIDDLADLLGRQSTPGRCGISHTRWATHGPATDANAHPHVGGNGLVAVVHNGVIENYSVLRDRLLELGYVFHSATDTEVIAHLIANELDPGGDGTSLGNHQAGAGDPPMVERLVDAVRAALSQLKGTYGLGVVSPLYPGVIIGARFGSPLVLGVGRGENFLASDPSAMLGQTHDVVYLQDNELALLQADQFRVTHRHDGHVEPHIHQIAWDPAAADKGPYDHFMLKEIFEQPDTIDNALRGRLDDDAACAHFGGLNLAPQQLRAIDRIVLTACGTSWHAGLVGEYLIEEFARIPVEVEYASEFRYRNAPIGDRTIVLAISQSGETADTLAAMRESKRKGHPTLALCNVVGSSIFREADGGVYLRAGMEVGVASTKAFTAQVVVLMLLALHLGRMRHLSHAAGTRIIAGLRSLPELIRRVLETEPVVRGIAAKYAGAANFLYLGRHYHFPIALEGALKLKEISYIHAEGYPAAEMKHGPIALVDEQTPSVFIIPRGVVYDKVTSNLEEIKARGGPVIAVACEGDEAVARRADDVIYIPDVEDYLQPLLTIVPLQLLAYHIAVLRGCDVDKPRNLAKSVTVE